MYLESKHANKYHVFKNQAWVSAPTDKFYFEVRIHIKLPYKGQGLDCLFCLTHQDIINLSRGLYHTNYTEIKKATLLQCITGFYQHSLQFCLFLLHIPFMFFSLELESSSRMPDDLAARLPKAQRTIWRSHEAWNKWQPLISQFCPYNRISSTLSSLWDNPRSNQACTKWSWLWRVILAASQAF